MKQKMQNAGRLLCYTRLFTRALIDDAGVDLVFGHSSHHPKALEVYNGRLILYGCGDLINDYEGIGRYDEYLLSDDLEIVIDW